MTPDSGQLTEKSRLPYIIAAVLYLVGTAAIAFAAFLTPLMCVSDKCIRDNISAPFMWALAGVPVALLLTILALVMSRRQPRWLSWVLILFPFLFWGVYIAMMNAANLL